MIMVQKNLTKVQFKKTPKTTKITLNLIPNFIKCLNKDGFSKETYESILYNEKSEMDYESKKTRFRCVNVKKEAHEGSINGVLILDTGIVVTSGSDNHIKFWDPMSNEAIAVINEKEKVGDLIQFKKERKFYYACGGCVKGFDYTNERCEEVYEGMSEIMCMTKLGDLNNDTIIVGLRDGNIEFISRKQSKTIISKPFHSGASVVSISAKNDIMLS